MPRELVRVGYILKIERELENIIHILVIEKGEIK